MTLGRTRCLYNVDSIIPLTHAHTPHPPLVLWFMLLFHVLSRICGICNTSKWGMVPICLSPVWVDLCTEGVGYSKWQKPATSLAHIFLFLSGDHQDCYPDVTEKIIFPGRQPRRSADKLLYATLSSTSPAVSFSLRGSSCLISADVCHHFFFISLHLNRFDLKDLFCPPPASMNTWNTCTRDLWPPLFAVRLSRTVKSCKWVSSVWKMIFFFSSTQLPQLSLHRVYRTWTAVLAQDVCQGSASHSSGRMQHILNFCKGHCKTSLTCGMCPAFGRHLFAPEM